MNGYTRDPVTGVWYKPTADGGIWFDPQRRAYYSAGRKAWAPSEQGPWPEGPAAPPANCAAPPANCAAPPGPAPAAAANGPGRIRIPHTLPEMPPGTPHPANGPAADADALWPLYKRMPLWERVRFLLQIDENEQGFNKDVIRAVNDAGPMSKTEFYQWLRENPRVQRLAGPEGRLDPPANGFARGRMIGGMQR